MDAVAALDRAIYFLERQVAPREKIRAFKNARDTIGHLGADEIHQRVVAGTIAELPGVGKSTGAVISEAIKGIDDGYLHDLDAVSMVPLGVGGELRSAIRGDCHMHSTWSDGAAPLAKMATTARSLGHEYVAATDHSARLTVAHGLSEQRLKAQLLEVAELNTSMNESADSTSSPFRILTGVEVDIFADGSLDLSNDLLRRLDVVVASAHSKLDLPRDEMTRRLITAVANPHVNILGHMTNRKLTSTGRPPSTFDAEMVLAACATFDTAVEINCRPERQDPPEELLELAIEWGCYVAINTDAHAPGQLEWQAFGCDKAVRCGVDPAKIVNTWPASELCSWASTSPKTTAVT